MKFYGVVALAEFSTALTIRYNKVLLVSESCLYLFFLGKSLRLLPFPGLLIVKTVKQAWRKTVAKFLLSRERDLSKKVGLS